MANNPELEAQGYIQYGPRPVRLCTSQIKPKVVAMPEATQTNNTRKINGYYANTTYVPFLYIIPFSPWIIPKQKAINNKHFLYSPVTISPDDVKPPVRTNELTNQQLSDIEDQIDNTGIAIIDLNEDQLFIGARRDNPNTGIFEL